MGAYDIESGKYAKLKKAFVVENGIYTKLKKAFVVEDGKYVKLWSLDEIVKGVWKGILMAYVGSNTQMFCTIHDRSGNRTSQAYDTAYTTHKVCAVSEDGSYVAYTPDDKTIKICKYNGTTYEAYCKIDSVKVAVAESGYPLENTYIYPSYGQVGFDSYGEHLVIFSVSESHHLCAYVFKNDGTSFVFHKVSVISGIYMEGDEFDIRSSSGQDGYHSISKDAKVAIFQIQQMTGATYWYTPTIVYDEGNFNYKLVHQDIGSASNKYTGQYLAYVASDSINKYFIMNPIPHSSNTGRRNAIRYIKDGKMTNLLYDSYDNSNIAKYGICSNENGCLYLNEAGSIISYKFNGSSITLLGKCGSIGASLLRDISVDGKTMIARSNYDSSSYPSMILSTSMDENGLITSCSTVKSYDRTQNPNIYMIDRT